jgi:hypothetical protein
VRGCFLFDHERANLLRKTYSSYTLKSTASSVSQYLTSRTWNCSRAFTARTNTDRCRGQGDHGREDESKSNRVLEEGYNERWKSLVSIGCGTRITGNANLESAERQNIEDHAERVQKKNQTDKHSRERTEMRW